MPGFRILFLILISASALNAQTFRQTQQKAARVKGAYKEKWSILKAELAKKGIGENFEMYLRVFKQEGKTELWLRTKGEKAFKLFKTYDICSSSGTLGPKRQQGDGQVPEGFYHIAVFNPYSSYHLSLGINYPNNSDRIVGKGNLGGDIMIHGSCVTIGCIPLTDNYIKEVYILAVEAKSGGQGKIPVHIFPSRLDDKKMNALKEEFASNAALIKFWNSLQPAYAFFEKEHRLPVVTTDKAGNYSIADK